MTILTRHFNRKWLF